MNLLSRILTTLLFTFMAAFIFLGVSTQNGVEIRPDQGTGEVNYFATVGGTGDCSSWNKGCTFRTAVAKCTGTKQCNVYLGAGVHDTNNVSTAAGTTISVNYVALYGPGDPDVVGVSATLANSHATATNILIVTGRSFYANRVRFTNAAQTDKIVTQLSLNGHHDIVRDCVFDQTTGDGANTGIYIDGGAAAAVSHTITGCRFRRLEGYGLNLNDAARFYIIKNVFNRCATGVYLSHANADDGTFRENVFTLCTTAVNGAAVPTKEHHWMANAYSACATNITDFSAYANGWWFLNVSESGIHRSVYPLTAAGATITKDANAYTWGSIQRVIPKDTLLKPFLLQQINVQSWSAAQTFYIELSYGETTGDNVIGIYEVTLGATGGSKVPVSVNTNVYVPARAYVGARIMSSTASTDDITFSLGYELL